jgi:hypothetical protein
MADVDAGQHAAGISIEPVSDGALLGRRAGVARIAKVTHPGLGLNKTSRQSKASSDRRSLSGLFPL